MTSAARRLLRLLGCLLATVLATMAVLWGVPAQARADEPLVTITFNSITPATLPTDPEARITISGSVKNTSGKPLSQVQVSFWRSTDPVTEADDVAQIVASPWDIPLGQRLTTEDPEHNLFNITSDARPDFEAGAQVTFQVSAQVKHLTFGTSPGARLIGVHVRAIPKGGYKRTVGRARAFMPTAPTEATPVASVVVLTSRPSMVSPGVFTDDHLAAELGGRLKNLLTLAHQRRATVLIDPSLYDEAVTMAHGYELTTGDKPARGRIVAQQWLTELATVRKTTAMHRLPYGHPNLMAAAQANQTGLLQATKDALPKDHPLAGLPLAVMGVGGQADDRFLDFVSPLSPALLVTAIPGMPAHSSVRGVTTLNADPRPFAGGPGPEPRTSLPQLRGRLATDLQLTHSGGIAVIFDSVDARATALAQLPPAVRDVTLDALPAAGESTLPSTTKVTLPSQDSWTHAETVQGQWASWGELLGQKAEKVTIGHQVVTRAFHTSLARDPRGAEAFLASARQQAPDVSRADVQLVGAKTFLVNQPQTTLPLTVRNNTDHPVTVVVAFRSDSPQRISLPATRPQVIEPKSSRTVDFIAHAHTNGAVTVHATLQTTDGVRIGRPHDFTVTANSLGSISWIVMVVSGAVVLGATGLRIRQVQRERAKAASQRAEQASEPVVIDTSVDLGTRPHP